MYGYAGQSYTDTLTGDIYAKPDMSQPSTTGWEIKSRGSSGDEQEFMPRTGDGQTSEQSDEFVQNVLTGRISPAQINPAEAAGFREVFDVPARDLSDITVQATIPTCAGDPPTVTPLGVVIDAAAVDGGLMAGGVVRVRDIHPDFPFEYVMYCSSDHNEGTSGPRPYYASSLVGPWLAWNDSSVAAALTDYGITLPSSTHSGCVAMAGWSGGDDHGEAIWAFVHRGEIWVYSHSQSLVPGQQVGFLCKSSDSVNLTYIEQFRVNSSDNTGGNNNHNGYMSVCLEGGTFVGNGALHDLNPVAYSRYYSADGVNWTGGDKIWWGREPALAGITDHTLSGSRHPINVAGEKWTLLWYARTTTSGGGHTGNTLVIARINDDGDIIAIPTVIAAPGEEGSFDGDGYIPYIPSFYRIGSQLYIFASVRSTPDGAAAIAAFKLDFTRRDPDAVPAWEVQEGYEPLCGRTPLSLQERGTYDERINFIGSSAPDGVTPVEDGTSAAVEFDSLASGRGGVRLSTGESNGSSPFAQLQWDDYALALDYVDAVEVEFDCVQYVTAPITSSSVFIGLATADWTSALGVRIRPPDAVNKGVMYSTAPSTFDYAEPSGFNPTDDARWTLPQRHKIGYYRIKSSADGSYSRWVVWYVYDQAVMARNLEDFETGLTLMPIVRVNRAQVRINSMRVRVRPLLHPNVTP